MAEQASKPIDLYLVSGFLGAGKTTFMRAMMENLAGRRLGVLVNEFGSIGIDGPLVDRPGVQLVEINDGSVFCACLKDGFVRTLKGFAEQPIDILLIECSGMADPAGMNTILNGLAPYLARPYAYRGCICLIDCTTFLDYVDVLMPIQNQVASSDFILVNKTDLVGPETINEVHRYIRLLNEAAYIHDTIYAHVPTELLEEKLANHGFSGNGSNTPSTRPSTYTLQADGVCEKEQLEAFYEGISGAVLRMKGFVRGPAGWWHVEGVARQFEVTPAELDVDDAALLAGGRLVVIATGREDIAPLVRDAWAAHCPAQMTLTAT